MEIIRNDIIQYISEKKNIEINQVKEIIKLYSELSINHIYSEKITDTITVLKHPVIDSLLGKTRRGIRIHIYGRPSSSKTSLAVSMASWYAYNKRNILWIDSSYYYPDLYIKNNCEKNKLDYINITRTCPTINDFEILSESFDLIIIDDTFSLNDDIREKIGIIGKICSHNKCDLLMLSQTRIDIFNYSNDIVPDIRATDCDILMYVTKAEKLNTNHTWRYSIKILSCRGKSKRESISYTVNHIGLDLPLFISKLAIEESVMMLRGPRIYHKGKPIAYVSKIHELGFDFVDEITYILEGEKNESFKF